MHSLQTFTSSPVIFPSLSQCVPPTVQFHSSADLFLWTHRVVRSVWTWLVLSECQCVEDKGNRAQGSHQYILWEQLAGWQDTKYFLQDTKQTVIVLTSTPCLVISLFLSRIGIERDLHSPLFSFMFFSLSLPGCLVPSPIQSFTHQFTLSPSRIHQQRQLILSLPCHRRLSHSPSCSRNRNSLFYFRCPSLILLALPSACVPSLALPFTPYLAFPLSISLAQWQTRLP